LDDAGKLAPERFANSSRRYVGHAYPDGRGFPGADGQLIMRGDFRASLMCVESVLVPRHQVVIYAILDIRAVIRSTKDPLVVGLVLRKQQGHFSLAVQEDSAKTLMGSRHNPNAARVDFCQNRLRRVGDPCPGIAEPQSRQNVDCGCLGSTIATLI